MALLDFLKLCGSTKLDAAKNVLEGTTSLGLHAVTISKEFLQLIGMSNYVLINFCKNSNKAKVYDVHIY